MELEELVRELTGRMRFEATTTQEWCPECLKPSVASTTVQILVDFAPVGHVVFSHCLEA